MSVGVYISTSSHLGRTLESRNLRPIWQRLSMATSGYPVFSVTRKWATGGKMVYISNGQVLDSRNQSPWRLSFITDFFWGIAEFVVFFFKTLLQQDVKKRRGYGGSSDSRYDDGRGPPGNPPRRMGRISHLRGPSPPPMAGG